MENNNLKNYLDDAIANSLKVIENARKVIKEGQDMLEKMNNKEVTLNSFIMELEAKKFYIDKEAGVFKKSLEYCAETYYINEEFSEITLDYPVGKIKFSSYKDCLDFINGDTNKGAIVSTYTNY